MPIYSGQVRPIIVPQEPMRQGKKCYFYPADFTWPTCHADWFSEGKYLPLTFFGQFNLEEISKYDKG